MIKIIQLTEITERNVIRKTANNTERLVKKTEMSKF